MVLQAYDGARRPARPILEACENCGGFAVMLLLGAAAWVGVFMVCSRF